MLRHPVAGRLWFAAAVSAAGDYVGIGALLLLAYERSGGRVLGAAAIFAVQAVPALLSGGLAGGWLDRIPRRPAMAALQVLGVVALGLAVVGPGLVSVLAAAALLGAVRAAFGAVRSGAVAEAVPAELRGSLLALIGVSEQASQVLGYLTGAAIALAVGPSPALVGDAATFALAAVIVLTLDLPPAEERKRRTQLATGLREIWDTPTLRLLAPLVWATGLVSALPESLAAGVPGAGESWLPFILAAGPAGQAATMAVLGRRREIEDVEFQLTHLATLALAFGVGALGSGPAWFLVANLGIGAGVAWTLGPQTLFVRVADPGHMAQITGVMIAGIIAAEGVGTLLFGAIADAAGVGRAYWVAGLVVLVAAIGAWVYQARVPGLDAQPDDRAERPPPGGGPSA